LSDIDKYDSVYICLTNGTDETDKYDMSRFKLP
jgi:hypothetical protein